LIDNIINYLKEAGPGLVDERAVKIFFFSVGASLCGLLSDILNNSYLVASGNEGGMKFSVMATIFQWIFAFFISTINLLPPFFIRFLLVGKKLETEWSIAAAAINYAAIMLIMALPWQFMFGNVGGGAAYFLLSRVMKMLFASIILISGYFILETPERKWRSAPQMEMPLDNSTRCLLKLGSFINYVKTNLGSEISVENLWQPVYTYLKNEEVINGAVNQGMTPDAIVLNAVGSMAFRLLAAGVFHHPGGPLSLEGEYVVSIWKIAADELIRNSFNTPADMARGLAALEEAIRRAGEWKN
jgi:hypothetical protein